MQYPQQTPPKVINTKESKLYIFSYNPLSMEHVSLGQTTVVTHLDYQQQVLWLFLIVLITVIA